MSASFAPYPAYRDSRVDWLGAIPEHWDTNKLRYEFLFGRGLGITKADLREAGIPCVSYGEVHSKFGFELDPSRHSLKCVDEKYLQSSPNSLLSKGDFVFADTSEDIEGAGNFTQLVKEGSVFAGYHTVIVRPKGHRNARFLAYALTSPAFRVQIRTAVKGVKVFSITQQILKGASFWLPPREEQDQIAGFLDYETANIDSLIEKQKQLIELLKEKRQAVISRVVTKGLNPDAPMRDSGVEWLGEVPAHWVVGRYKFCTSRVVVGIAEAATHAYSDSGVPIIRSTNIREDGLDASDILYIREGFAERNQSKYLYSGDVVTVRTGYPGVSCVVPASFDKSQCFTTLIATPNQNMESEFLSSYLNSHAGKSYFELLGWGSAQKNISVPILQNIPIAYPDEDEQVEIVRFISSQKEKYVGLIGKAELQIELLSERRAALISAAVTGKIDVRDWQPPANQEKEAA